MSLKVLDRTKRPVRVQAASPIAVAWDKVFLTYLTFLRTVLCVDITIISPTLKIGTFLRGNLWIRFNPKISNFHYVLTALKSYIDDLPKINTVK